MYESAIVFAHVLTFEIWRLGVKMNICNRPSSGITLMFVSSYRVIYSSNNLILSQI